ncbi:MAG: Integrase catalytic region [Marmoricola sp.]|jgi:hypothetical protein|nr:Integrase catalytic region [Marmoricola sp.]
MIIDFIEANRHDVVEGRKLGVEPICRTLSQAGLPVASSLYYAVRSRPASLRAQREARPNGARTRPPVPQTRRRSLVYIPLMAN